MCRRGGPTVPTAARPRRERPRCWELPAAQSTEHAVGQLPLGHSPPGKVQPGQHGTRAQKGEAVRLIGVVAESTGDHFHELRGRGVIDAHFFHRPPVAELSGRRLHEAEELGVRRFVAGGLSGG